MWARLTHSTSLVFEECTKEEALEGGGIWLESLSDIMQAEREENEIEARTLLAGPVLQYQ